jgi:hypothetical protein
VRAGDPLALVPLLKLRRVFAVERLSAALGETPEQRLLRRTEYSAPAIAELRAWIDENRGVIPPKTPPVWLSGKAISIGTNSSRASSIIPTRKVCRAFVSSMK